MKRNGVSGPLDIGLKEASETSIYLFVPLHRNLGRAWLSLLTGRDAREITTLEGSLTAAHAFGLTERTCKGPLGYRWYIAADSRMGRLRQ